MSKRDDIKVGDQVAVVAASVWSRGAPIRSTVARTTATQIILGEDMRFSRRNGLGIGHDKRHRIEPWDEKHDKAVAAAVEGAERSTVLYAMENRVQTRKLSLDQLRRIAAILGEDRA